MVLLLSKLDRGNELELTSNIHLLVDTILILLIHYSGSPSQGVDPFIHSEIEKRKRHVDQDG